MNNYSFFTLPCLGRQHPAGGRGCLWVGVPGSWQPGVCLAELLLASQCLVGSSCRAFPAHALERTASPIYLAAHLTTFLATNKEIHLA